MDSCDLMELIEMSVGDPQRSVSVNTPNYWKELNEMVHEHAFVRYVSYTRGLKHPVVAVYNDQQIQDIKRFCCRENGAVLGIGKTSNMGEFLITTTVYEDLSVVRRSTNEHPICLGPTIIHQRATRDFPYLLIDLQGKLNKDVYDSDEFDVISDLPTSTITVGRNGKLRLKNEIGQFLRGCTQVICVSKMKEMTYMYLKTKTRYLIRERDYILEAIFGEEGFLENTDIDTFTHKLEELKKTIAELDSNSRGKKFLAYFENTILPYLTDHVIEPIRQGKLQRPWSFKGCEAVNVLTTGVKLKGEDMPEFINKLHSVVKDHHDERCDAITDEGSLRVADEFAKYRTDKRHWASLTREERLEWVDNFQTDGCKPDTSKPVPQDDAYTISR